MNSENLLERDLNLRPQNYRTWALSTELSNLIRVGHLDIFVLAGGGGAKLSRSHLTHSYTCRQGSHPELQG